MIPITKPFLPPIEEFNELIKGVWDRQWLTNNGPLVNELELKLKEYLNLPHILYLNNGTIALQIAIKALALQGKIITTPFTYVATVSSIVWEGCEPIFVDIDEESLNLDPKKIEEAITSDTVAIIATHVFGNPCAIDEIEKIAQKHNLKVIYDAAHCFGTKYQGKSIFEYGDISTTSFHATKIFHTIEGGAVFSNNADLIKKMAFLRNFGHNGQDDFAEVGINGKNSEFHASMGILNLKYFDKILETRQNQCLIYRKWLTRDIIRFPKINVNSTYNSAYFPIILDSEEIVLKVIEALESAYISPRRYFYPSLNTVKIYNGNDTPISESISRRILCLPLYHTLLESDINYICRIVLRTLNN